jgi:ABC-type glycerol-3-phosphate transport system substrate-binding protein
VRALIVLAVLSVSLAGCGSGSSGGADTATSLTITYWADGPEGEAETWTLACDPASGTIADPAAA